MTLLERVIAAVLAALGFHPPMWTRRVLHLTDTDPHEVASSALPWSTSSWRGAIAGGVSKGARKHPRELHQSFAMGVGGTFRFDGEHLEVLDAPMNDHERAPVRVWLEARAGAVRLMVASKGSPVFVRFDGLHETRTVAA